MLYIVSTPIGNLNEISLRAIETLKSVSLIAAEDTRHSAVLLKALDIKTHLTAYQKFNEAAVSEMLIGRLKNGEDIALISDAGTPLISDPGSVLIDKCIENDIEFTCISGPCALINALLLSGLSAAEFAFLGFLPDKQKLRREKIAPYAESPATLIFYSPPQSVVKDLEFLYETLGDRKAAVVREMTKKFEQVQRFKLSDIPEITLKGEFVIVTEGYKKPLNEKPAEELIEEYIQSGMGKMDAIKKAAKEKGLSKSAVYSLIHNTPSKID